MRASSKSYVARIKSWCLPRLGDIVKFCRHRLKVWSFSQTNPQDFPSCRKSGVNMRAGLDRFVCVSRLCLYWWTCCEIATLLDTRMTSRRAFKRLCGYQTSAHGAIWESYLEEIVIWNSESPCSHIPPCTFLPIATSFLALPTWYFEIMSDSSGKKLSPWGVLKELFNWYPKEYPKEERKWVRLDSIEKKVHW